MSFCMTRSRQLPPLSTGTHTIPYPEITKFHILVLGPLTPQIEEWRRRDVSSFCGREKLYIFILTLCKKTLIGPFFEARTAQKPYLRVGYGMCPSNQPFIV